jgi:GT2 family glycosyltransferase
MLQMGRPLASVVVLNHNNSRYIPDCLASLLDQEMPKGSYEVIFADNGSNDDSVDIVRNQFPEVQLIEFSRNYGFCEGNNRVVEYARGKYIVFLNIDTVVHRKWLSELVNVAESDETVKACQSNMLMPWVKEFRSIDREGFPRNVYYYDLTRFGYAAYVSKPFEERPMRSVFLEGGSLLIERDLISSPNYAFDPDFGSYCEDLDLALRMNIWGYKTITVPTSIVYHINSFSVKARTDKTSICTAIRIVRNRIIAFHKNMTNAEFVLFLPWLLIGSPFKVRQFGWSLSKQFVYWLGAIPITLLGLQQALFMLHQFKEKRQENLKRRRCGNWWLLKKVLEGTDR